MIRIAENVFFCLPPPETAPECRKCVDMSPPDLATFRSINSRVAIVVGSVAEWSRHPTSNLETRV